MKKLFTCLSVRDRTVSNERGFTAIELLVVVIAILALLAVVGPKLFRLTQKSNEAGASSQLDSIIKAITLYYGENKSHPKAWTDLTSGDYLVATPDANWTISCTNGGDLKVTYAASDLASTLDTEWDKKCEGGASIVTGTSNVECVLVTAAYCP